MSKECQDNIKEYYSSRKFHIKVIPEYSPQLNPLETMLSNLKAIFRKSRESQNIRDPEEIDKLIEETFENENMESLYSNYQKMRYFAAKALQRE